MEWHKFVKGDRTTYPKNGTYLVTISIPCNGQIKSCVDIVTWYRPYCYWANPFAEYIVAYADVPEPYVEH